ncbi:MAG: type II toxin-antitoxin system RelE/ParE family toxin [Deltaproteobacteria bacterium]|nr:type II toxin-antitoxin system RelE/ParE family toxin [Deltaproteobacteria bacterium]
MRVIASNKFIKFKKKIIKKLQIELDNRIKEIIKNPERGEIKKN